MKIELLSILSLAFLLILFSNVSSAQNPIPNPGFEGWLRNIPNGWSAPTNIPLAGIEPITKSPEAYSDSWAVRGFVLDFSSSHFSSSYMHINRSIFPGCYKPPGIFLFLQIFRELKAICSLLKYF
ncbi:MAG: hypothetical protein IPJ03_14915 [Ignavibacteriales bacterium]|nr:hypothetical protein [Ignavibacteriales bacterium]